jgi:hypothetical protein
MRAVKQGLLWALAAGTSASALAGTVHHVRFAQPAQILVWEHGELVGHGDRIQLIESHDVRPERLIGNGTLLPVENRISGTRTIAVASNTAFILKSDSAAGRPDVTVRVLSERENAQARIGPSRDSAFRQSVKTAARPGAPASQAIELEISWSGDQPPDLFIIAD